MFLSEEKIEVNEPDLISDKDFLNLGMKQLSVPNDNIKKEAKKKVGIISVSKDIKVIMYNIN